MTYHLVSSLVIVLLVIIYLIIFSGRVVEGFNDFITSPRYCGDCNTVGKKGIANCLSCSNCGWCVDPNGYGSCVLGDYTGPYFADCSQYTFGGNVIYPIPNGNANGNANGNGNGNANGNANGNGNGNANGNGNSNGNKGAMTGLPFTVSTAGALQDISASPWGTSTYESRAPLRSGRRWRPTGLIREWN